jgi:uncharacterized protein
MTDAGSGTPPQPLPDLDTEGFWQATARGEIALGRCQKCRTWQHPPTERCIHCAGPMAFEPISGNGTVYSYIIANRASVPGFAVPYVVAVIELDEQPGLKMVGRLAGVEPGEAKIGQRVSTTVVPLPGGDYRIPQFTVVEG